MATTAVRGKEGGCKFPDTTQQSGARWPSIPPSSHSPEPPAPNRLRRRGAGSGVATL